jgi:hypothetical protein
LRKAGLRSIPLFRSDQRNAYFAPPLQDLQIGTLRFATNALGMRNGPLGPKKGRRVLVIVESVINGGFTVDQNSIATERANSKARAEGREVEYLNLSANDSLAGWGSPTFHTYHALEDQHYAHGIQLSVAGQAAFAQFLVGYIEEAYSPSTE